MLWAASAGRHRRRNPQAVFREFTGLGVTGNAQRDSLPLRLTPAAGSHALEKLHM